MKQTLFILALFLSYGLQAQNYLFEITPDNGEFRVIITDDTKESYPRQVTDFGLLDTASLQLLAIQRIENVKNRQASQQAQSFLSELNADQTNTAVGAFVSINYGTWAAAQFATAYDGNYHYEVRGTATDFPIYINGTEVRRTSNDNLLATITAQTGSWFVVDVGGDLINLYKIGQFWVGRNQNDQIVTLKKL